MNTPVLIGDVVRADCAELRELADWFDRRRNDSVSAKFLRAVADRHEVICGAYFAQQAREQHVVVTEQDSTP